MQKPRKTGTVIIPSNSHPWPHEERIAKILAKAGHKIEFIPEGRLKTADIVLDGTEFEIKSPVSHNINAVGRNLSRGSKQSPNLIFDSSRMKNIRDTQIIRILTNYLRLRKRIHKIIFINKHGKIIDISQFI